MFTDVQPWDLTGVHAHVTGFRVVKKFDAWESSSCILHLKSLMSWAALQLQFFCHRLAGQGYGRSCAQTLIHPISSSSVASSTTTAHFHSWSSQVSSVTVSGIGSSAWKEINYLFTTCLICYLRALSFRIVPTHQHNRHVGVRSLFLPSN